MKIETEGFQLTISLADLVEELSLEDRAKLARLVAADEKLFEAVLDCVVKGDFFEDVGEGSWWFSQSSIAKLREKLIPLMGDVARGVVHDALQGKKDAQHQQERWQDYAIAMERAWPVDRYGFKPKCPEWTAPPQVTEREVCSLIPSDDRPDSSSP